MSAPPPPDPHAPPVSSRKSTLSLAEKVSFQNRLVRRVEQRAAKAAPPPPPPPLPSGDARLSSTPPTVAPRFGPRITNGSGNAVQPLRFLALSEVLRSFGKEIPLSDFDVLPREVVEDLWTALVTRGLLSDLTATTLSPWGLTHLDLTGCIHLTDFALEGPWTKSNPSLHTIVLSDCSNITDRGLVSLLKLPNTLSQLYELNVSGTSLSSQALAEILSRCSTLKVLNVSGIASFDEDAWTAAKAACGPELKLADNAPAPPPLPTAPTGQSSRKRSSSVGRSRHRREKSSSRSPDPWQSLTRRDKARTSALLASIRESPHSILSTPPRHLIASGVKPPPRKAPSSMTSKPKPARLTSLDASHTPGNGEGVLSYLADHGQDLVHLNVADKPMENLWKTAILPSLTSLDISGCTKINDHHLVAACLTLPQLKRLIVARAWRLREEGMDSVLHACMRLEELDVSGCRQLGWNFLSDVAATQRHLRVVRLEGLWQMVDAPVQMFLVSCGAGLEELSLSGMSNIADPTMYSIGAHAPNLKKLSMYGIRSSISTEGWKRVVDGCPKLTSINLHRVGAFSDDALQMMLTPDRQMEYLNLSLCQQLTPAGLSVFLKPQSLTSLKVCILVNSDNITAKELKGLEAARSLEELNLSSTEAVNDNAIAGILRSCSKLKNLVLYNCSIGDDTLIRLNSLPELEALNIGRTYGCTAKGLRAIAQNNPMMNHLNVSEVRGFNVWDVLDVISAWPRLRTFTCRRFTVPKGAKASLLEKIPWLNIRN